MQWGRTRDNSSQLRYSGKALAGPLQELGLWGHSSWSARWDITTVLWYACYTAASGILALSVVDVVEAVDVCLNFLLW
jgi:hypothetical protein